MIVDEEDIQEMNNQKTSFAENCATLGVIGDSVAAVALIEPKPPDESVAIGLFRLFLLITLKYSALNSKALVPSKQDAAEHPGIPVKSPAQRSKR